MGFITDILLLVFYGLHFWYVKGYIPGILRAKFLVFYGLYSWYFRGYYRGILWVLFLVL